MTSDRLERPDTDLLDRAPVGAADIVAVETAVADLLHTSLDVVLLQAEAIVALEATARGLAHPGVTALNVVTGPYGALFGRWMTRCGADVLDLVAPPGQVADPADIARALQRNDIGVVAVVHAEAATGGANHLADIAAAVREAGALLVVDAVASIGAQPVTPDEWTADVVVIGAQKALAGPAGVSALAVSERAWTAMAANPGAPRESILSLLDLHDGWLRSDRTTVPGTPSSLETSALRQALARVAAEGLPAVLDRHAAAAAAARAGVRALGLQPFIADDSSSATVVTTVRAPDGVAVAELVAAARGAGARLIGPAPGDLAATVLRINHTGRAAQLPVVERELNALAAALALVRGHG